MPLTVAPPPRTGDAAQGPLFTGSTWSAAPDPAAPEPVEPVTEPSHPKPAATARTVAAGTYLAVLAMAMGACLVLVVVSVRLITSGHARLDLGMPSAQLLTVAFAAATIAALLVLTSESPPPRVSTAVLAFVVSVAWPLSGIPLAALIAIVAVGIALGRDRRVDGGSRVAGWPTFGAFTAAALVLAIAGAALAQTHPPRPLESASPTLQSPATAAPAKEKGAIGTDVATPDVEGAKNAESMASPEPEAQAEHASRVARAPEQESETPTAEQAPLGQAGTPPALDAEAPPASDARRFVRDYYRALDERRFEDAWTTLSPAVKKRFGGFTGWKAGYATTLYSKPRTIAVTASGATVTVTHLLVARDEGCSADSRFNVTWALDRSGEQWTVTALSASVAGANTAECR